MPPPSKSNRRDFLKGRSAAKSLGEVIESIDQPSLPPPASLDSSGQTTEATGSQEPAPAKRSGHLIHIGREAMASQFEVILTPGDHGAATEAALEALDMVDQLEEQLSVYRDSSELCRLNRQAPHGPVVVEPHLFDLLHLAAELHRQTEGALDISSTPLSRLWGFHRRQGQLPTDEQITQVLEQLGTDQLQFDSHHKTVTFAKENLEINLNCLGKGYALDRAALGLVELGVDDFLFQGGQSSVLARGGRYGKGTSWPVAVRHPLRPEIELALIALSDAALGTSGTATQHFHHRGKRYGHLFDPRTGWPAEGTLSTTIVAPTATLADALSTACYVLGVDRACQLQQERGDFALLMVTPGTRTGSIRIHAEGFTEGMLHINEGEHFS